MGFEYQKIKDLRRPGNKYPKTKKQIEASKRSGVKVMLGDKNPMKNPQSRARLSRAKKGIITSPQNLFKEGNKFGALRSDESKKQSGRRWGMMNIGRPAPQIVKDKLQLQSLLNNPMKNPEIARKTVLKGWITRKKNMEKRLMSNQIAINEKEVQNE